jgi:hypothetical protein
MVGVRGSRMTRPVAVALVVTCLVGQAHGAGGRLEAAATERALTPGCGRSPIGVRLALDLIDGSEWVLAVDGGEYRGTYVSGGAQRRRLAPAMDDASLAALANRLAARMSALCGRR